MQTKQINPQQLKKAQKIARAISHPTRGEIMAFISENKGVPVGDIYRTLKMEQAPLSMHLKILREANLVADKKVGKCRYYSVNVGYIEQIKPILEGLAN